MSRSNTAKMAAAKHKKRPPSALHPNSRRTRNADPRGLAFMAWVRTLPCVICYTQRLTMDMYLDLIAHDPGNATLPCGNISGWRTTFAHIGGNLAAKAPNLHGIPLCQHHHDSNYVHCEHLLKKSFGPHWGIDIEALIVKLNAEFDRLYPPGTKGLLE